MFYIINHAIASSVRLFMDLILMDFMAQIRHSFCIQGGPDVTLTPLLFNNMNLNFNFSN